MDANPRSIGTLAKGHRFDGAALAKGTLRLSLVRAATPTDKIRHPDQCASHLPPWGSLPRARHFWHYALMTDSGTRGFDAVKLFGPPALVVAFFFQPDLAALSPDDRTALMLITLLTMVGFAAVFEFFRAGHIRGIVSAALMAVSTLTWNAVIRGHEQSGRANDKRCLAIQRDMLSSQPRRADGPDLFQALGCRPQGEGSVYAQPPKSGPRK